MTALVMPPLPTPPTPPPHTPFPVIAVIAPAVGAVVILLITGSVFVLVFAALTPLIAIATTLDARRTARRHVREEAARFDRDCAAWLARVPELHALERARADAARPPLHELLRAGDPQCPADAPVRVGVAPGPSAIAPERPAVLDDGPVARRLAELVSRASLHPALPVAVPAGPIRIVGRGRAADSVARLVGLHPACVVDRVRTARVPHGDAGAALVPVELVVESPTRMRVRLPDGVEHFVQPEGATLREQELVLRRRSPGVAALPPSVAWSTIRAEAIAGSVGSEAAPGVIGVDAAGPVGIDLLGDAPHALVGGTTGSGKSEFLRTVALAWVEGASPADRSILLVDFKGGSAFAELAILPHVAGLLTDLDAVAAERALRSLRAEIRRRERVLLTNGAREIGDMPSGVLARLLILVDEYAVLVESFPELQPLIADIAARGRSLGMHLVLCTQRPAGVVRDAVAANCGIRVAFRMASTAESKGFLPGPPPPDDSPAGRAALAVAGRSSSVQIATIGMSDIRAVADRWRAAEPAPRPWLPPLPDHVRRAHTAAMEAEPESESETASGPADGLRLTIGIVDDPDRQRRLRGEWSPQRDGALLIVGGRGSGAEDALAVLGESAVAAGCDAVVLPRRPADAVGALLELREELESGPRAPDGPRRLLLLLIPEIDVLVAEAGDRAIDVLEALDAADRRIRRRGGAIAASCSSVLRARAGVVGRFDSVLLLRAASLDDHRAAGGSPAGFDPSAPRGRGLWRGRAIQVLEREQEPIAARIPVIPVWSPPAGLPIAVVSPRPTVTADRLRRRGIEVGSDPMVLAGVGAIVADGLRGGPAHGVVVADAETWQATWSALALARREGVVVLVDASESDARAVLGARARIPLRDDDAPDEVIVVDSRGPFRARWAELEPDLGSAADRIG
ncbi:hypothetical protein GCM10009792_06730 [Microcella alkalica]|uniref:S-DNA-T family DNA segregation ATPase FtsK/SpoIIIE n=1 Tax=Microcella alkalica TaxID=355930 RepID=A0A839EBU9_9MICO|nr:FtsK/SpoIIIE domain-containing protein [Microcella alkalica]MBA8846795.1 S-DNA-T family DNA segregation ATPase FtsK/SpoIIIE [Microcella alkalica]